MFDSYLSTPAPDRKLAKRIPLPDPAASFAGMVRIMVVQEPAKQVLAVPAFGLAAFDQCYETVGIGKMQETFERSES